jgi:hypothetical protein
MGIATASRRATHVYQPPMVQRLDARTTKAVPPTLLKGKREPAVQSNTMATVHRSAGSERH